VGSTVKEGKWTVNLGKWTVKVRKSTVNQFFRKKGRNNFQSSVDFCRHLRRKKRSIEKKERNDVFVL
jgi:hypothetical protein